MSVEVDVHYTGELHCELTHGPSGERFFTDAPVDNRGRGEFFSPTDLVGAAMGSCMLTIMGIAAQDKGLDMSGARASISKEMKAEPMRHISKLTVKISLPKELDERGRKLLEAAALGCPVHASMGERTQIDVQFLYD